MFKQILMTILTCIRYVRKLFNKYSDEEVEEIKQELQLKLNTLVDINKYDSIPKPTKYDWLYNVRERGQTIDEYINYRYTKPDSIRKKIYILPITSENDIELNYDKIIRYVSIFFQMDTILMKEIDIKSISEKYREQDFFKHKQYLTGDIMKNLLKIIPNDAFCMLGVTNVDLYPDDNYSFVFGVASYHQRVGISSILRFSESFYKNLSKDDMDEYNKIYNKEYNSDFIQEQNMDTMLNRTTKIITHEILHMFSMEHCIYYNCLMCGINGMIELDRWSHSLCCICIQKLYIATNFDIKKRQTELVEYYKNNDMIKEIDKNTIVDQS